MAPTGFVADRIVLSGFAAHARVSLFDAPLTRASHRLGCLRSAGSTRVK